MARAFAKKGFCLFNLSDEESAGWVKNKYFNFDLDEAMIKIIHSQSVISGEPARPESFSFDDINESEPNSENESTESEDGFGSRKRFDQIYDSITEEKILYDELKELKKQRNQQRRMPQHRRNMSSRNLEWLYY